MVGDNVLKFPAAQNPQAERLDGRTVQAPRAEQLDLFSRVNEKLASFIFISVENLDQHVLLALFTKHSVKTIIDLRGRAVFPKPHFDHKFIMSYFYDRSMDYIEFALSRSTSFDSRLPGRPDDCDQLEEWFSRKSDTGITACIVDSAAVESGVVAAFRDCVTRRNRGLVELHPRSLT